MITVQSSSNISILCDCPYAGKTREIKENSEADDETRMKLQEEVKQVKGNLVLARNVLIDTYCKLATFKRILSLEAGCIIDPFTQPETTRKERIREASYLKSELTHLVNYLREYEPQRYRNGTDSYNPAWLSTSTEDLLLVKQERALKHLYHGYSVYKSRNETSAGVALREFLELKGNYENQLYANKIMEKEIVTIKKRISDLQHQYLEDKSLIDFVTSHHFKMKGTFLEDACGGNAVDSDNEKEEPEDSEALKFKNLWEESQLEKQKIVKSLQKLAEKLEFANRKIVRAENICSANIVSFRILDKKFKHGILLSKMTPKKTYTFGKYSAIQFRSQKSQLEASMDENKYLRNFLTKAILSKKEDHEKLLESLKSTRDKYRTELEDVRSKITPKQ